MTSPTYRRIDTLLGRFDVAVTLLPDGRYIGRLVTDRDDLAVMVGAIGQTVDEAVARLTGMVNLRA